MDEQTLESEQLLANVDYLDIEEKIKAGYRLVTTQYRRDDEIEVTTQNHRRLRQTLRQICRSFPREINVLDAGCGTGRYFHCLENVNHLVGLDVSREMLRAARRPVHEEQISARTIELVRGNVYLHEFPAGSFDFIYSLGMFGHGCPVTVDICNQFYTWLAAGGKVLFNVVDFEGLPLCTRLRRKIRCFLYPRLTGALRKVLDEREKRSPFFALTRGQLQTTLAASRFKTFSVASHVCLSPLWSGRHLECLAVKEA